jgi:carboxyl-terminal processing protease
MKRLLLLLGVLIFGFSFVVDGMPACPPAPVRGLENESTTGFPDSLGQEVRKSVVKVVQARIATQYFDERIAKTDFAAQAKLALAATSEHGFYEALRAWMTGLDEDFSVFESPKTIAANAAFNDGTYVGIGMTSNASSQDYYIVTGLNPNGSAIGAGLRVGDRILAVNGNPCVTRDQIRGPEGSGLRLRLQSRGEAAREIDLKRVKITASEYQMVTRQFGRIGYIWLPFVPEEIVFSAALEKLLAGETLEGMIVDFRGSRFFEARDMQSVLGHFMPGQAVHFLGRNGRNTQPALIKFPTVSVPLAVLQDVNTSVVSPWVTALLRTRAKTVLVGSSVPFDDRGGHTEKLLDGSEMMVFSSRFGLEGDQVLAERLEPDVAVSEDWFSVKEADDPFVRAALQALEKLK